MFCIWKKICCIKQKTGAIILLLNREKEVEKVFSQSLYRHHRHTTKKKRTSVKNYSYTFIMKKLLVLLPAKTPLSTIKKIAFSDSCCKNSTTYLQCRNPLLYTFLKKYKGVNRKFYSRHLYCIQLFAVTKNGILLTQAHDRKTIS